MVPAVTLVACAGTAWFFARWGVGSSALAAIDPHLRGFYRDLFERAFTGEIVEHQYQCHLPKRFREFRMRLLPDPKRATALFEHALVVDRNLFGYTDLDDDAIRRLYLNHGVVVQCCHCRKAKRNGSGDEWSRLIVQPWPGISHRLCPVCLEYSHPKSPDGEIAPPS